MKATGAGGARFVRRAVSFLVDYLVMVAWMAVLLALSGPIGIGELMARGPNLAHGLAFLSLTLPVWAYYALFEASPWGATPGKRLLGLAVRDVRGHRASFARTAARNAVKLLPWEIAHAGLHRIDGWPLEPAAPGVVHWIAFGTALALMLTWIATAVGRTPYDRLSGTVVDDRRDRR